MVNKSILTKIITVLAVVLIVSTVAFAQNDEYSSSSDPLVTLSYINDTLKPQLKNAIIDELKSSGFQLPSSETAGSEYVVEHLKSGEQLIAKASCEIILRSGEANVVSPFIEEALGLSDMTSGKEITNGQALHKNHYTLIPRGDGRGVVVTSDEV